MLLGPINPIFDNDTEDEDDDDNDHNNDFESGKGLGIKASGSSRGTSLRQRSGTRRDDEPATQ